ncbi:MAG: hypothetical protein RSF67_02700 [Clostridia bacterium]
MNIDLINQFRTTINGLNDFYIVDKNDFNGEIWNLLEVINQFVSDGYTFKEINQNTFSVTVHKQRILDWINTMEDMIA